MNESKKTIEYKNMDLENVCNGILSREVGKGVVICDAYPDWIVNCSWMGKKQVKAEGIDNNGSFGIFNYYLCKCSRNKL